MNSFGLFLITISILQYTVIPLFADLNRTHAANPEWPGHARNHLVTQVLTTSALGILALFFLWSGRVSDELGICLAVLLSAAALGPFFISSISAPLFGGQITPTREGLGMITIAGIEGNLANFGFSAVLLVTGRLLLL
jgi:hypothetical protein